MTEEIRTKEGSEEIEKNEEIEGKESGIEEETGRRTKSTQAKNQTGQMRKKKAMQMRKREKAGRLFVLGLGICACVLLVVYAAMVIWKDKDAGGSDAKEVQPVNFVAQKEDYSGAEVEKIVQEAAKEAAQAKEKEILDGIKENLTNGQAVAKALRPFYPQDVVVATGGKIRFFPIDDSLKKNTYRQENLIQKENGELEYAVGEEVISRKGIDVSYHQGEIDWEQVASDGVEFTIIRAGLRGYGTGKLVADEQFVNNVTNALSNGIKVGIYFYSHAVSEEEALEEARFVLEVIAPYRITGPVVFDGEKVKDSRTSSLSIQDRTNLAKLFCDTVKEAGYRPMIYLNLEVAFSVLDLTQLEEYDKWLAHYGADMYYPYDYKIWQYSEQGSVKGISSPVDLNISFESWD